MLINLKYSPHLTNRKEKEIKLMLEKRTNSKSLHFTHFVEKQNVIRFNLKLIFIYGIIDFV